MKHPKAFIAILLSVIFVKITTMRPSDEVVFRLLHFNKLKVVEVGGLSFNKNGLGTKFTIIDNNQKLIEGVVLISNNINKNFTYNIPGYELKLNSIK